MNNLTNKHRRIPEAYIKKGSWRAPFRNYFDCYEERGHVPPRRRRSPAEHEVSIFSPFHETAVKTRCRARARPLILSVECASASERREKD